MELKYIKRLIVLSLFFSIGCVKNKPINDIYGQLVLPDTIKAGKYYNVFIDYNNEEYNEKERSATHPTYRMLSFHFTIDTIIHDRNGLKYNIKDSVFSSNNNKIDLYEISIENPGVRYISGMIKDKLYIDSLNQNSKNPLLSGSVIESYLTKKVVVIE